MTAADVTKILLDEYHLSDLEFGIGATIEDLQFGLDDFVENNFKAIVEMIEEDSIGDPGTHWDF